MAKSNALVGVGVLVSPKDDGMLAVEEDTVEATLALPEAKLLNEVLNNLLEIIGLVIDINEGDTMNKSNLTKNKIKKKRKSLI